MKISVNEDHILLEEVYNGVELKTRDGEFMGICMRDTGFEFNYEGTWYEAKNGKIRELNQSKDSFVDGTMPPMGSKEFDSIHELNQSK